MKKYLIAAGIILMTSCSNTKDDIPWRLGGNALEKMSHADVRACKAKSGKVTPGYIAETCVYPTKDAGQSCTDSKQCEAGCIAPRGSKQNDMVTGTCNTVAGRAGCTNWIYDGYATGVICAD